MARLRKQKSRKQQATELAVDYLKLKAAGKAAKGARKGAGKAAKGTTLVVAKSSKKARFGVLAGAGVLAVVAAKLIHGHGHSEPSTA
jgi:hypothetical protein